MTRYFPKEIENKISDYWNKNLVYKTKEFKNNKEKKFYSLYAFPYPSGSGLHVGHASGMIANDILSRYHRMQNFSVLFPMGWDAFGLPAENYAIKTGTPPQKSTDDAIQNFKKQIDLLGISVDWNKELGTHTPEYYRWTQWIFLELFKRKKAYKAFAPVNWCPCCQTVLANEQVIENKCERCDSTVELKEMSQWFFKITDYAKRLYIEIDKVDWPKGTKEHQKNWIGLSEGSEIFFPVVKNFEYKKILVATTNESKIKRFKNLFKIMNLNVNVEAVSNYKSIEENRVSGLENSLLKVKSIKQKFDFPIIAEDTEIVFPTLNIKTTEVKRIALSEKEEKNYSQEEISKIVNEFYKNLAKKNGGELDFYYINNYSILFPDGNIKQIQAKREYILTNKEHSEIDVWMPMRNLYISKATGKPSIYEDFENNDIPEEYKIEFSPILKALSESIFERLGTLKIFTTRIDTIYGTTFCVVAPENPILNDFDSFIINKKELGEYISRAKNKTTLQRQTEKEKTGIKIEGISTINPFSFELLPIFTSDYVLSNYGTGAIMAVPAHDERDYEFAKKYNLPIKEVIKKEKIGKNTDENKLFTEYGVLVNSREYTGLTSIKAIEKMQNFAEKENFGKKRTTYKLRDWLVSRQRYWGAPIPIIYSKKAEEEGYGYVPKESLNILFLHGFDSIGLEGWRIPFKIEMEKLGCTAYFPDLPNSREPNYTDWIDFVLTKYKNLFENNKKLVLIGHSLGGLLAIKIAEFYEFKKLILIAPAPSVEFLTDEEKLLIKNKNNFLYQFLVDLGKINFDKVKKNIDEIVVLNSKNDEVVNIEKQEYFKKNLSNKAIFRDFENYGHFSSKKDNLVVFEELYPYINIKNNSEHIGIFPVFEKDLPVRLPTDVDFRPTGESPIKYSKSFNKNVVCPIFGTPAYREIDTMDTFVDSSWYFLRYVDPKNNDAAFSKEEVSKWLPPDIYMIGAEHTVLHLLYSRFFVKFFYDCGYINFDEPFPKVRHTGLILGADGRKMSKRWGNIINPTQEIEKYGADTLRMYIMFMGPYEDSKPWNDKTEKGVFKFLNRLWSFKDNVVLKINDESRLKKQKQVINLLIKQVSEDIENCSFNTAVAKFMETLNFFYDQKEVDISVWKVYLKLIAPFAPFVSEEIWQSLGERGSIHLSSWPKFDETIQQDDVYSIGVQINGKIRGTIVVNKNTSEEEAFSLSKENIQIYKYFQNSKIKKIIYIPCKILSIIVEK